MISKLRSEQKMENIDGAALKKPPKYNLLQKCLTTKNAEGKESYEDGGADVKLNLDARKDLVRKIVPGGSNEHFLKKFRDRIDRVGIQLPMVQVKFEHLTVEANCYMGNRALPSLLNTMRNITESALNIVGIRQTRRTTLTILKDVSGIIHPKRMTLLLGPPSSGKTTLLLALAGKLDTSLKTTGDVTYNGYKLDEFVPQKTAAYVSQNDHHIACMTVKETLNFSARCQGIGNRMDILNEVGEMEKQTGIHPEPEVHLFMKATAAGRAKSSLQTDYTLKILGLDVCADTIVGDHMISGISGGQKKRVTTGEIIVGPTKTLLMDEITNGLDSSTTFQIVKCIQQTAHVEEATILISLLQPAPEIFDLFDDVILLSEGRIVYQGPREFVIEFFRTCGFCCPERKGTADFLQEVTSRKDQEKYWVDDNKEYRYISVPEFVERFKTFHVGIRLKEELYVPFDKGWSHKGAIVFSKQCVPPSELLKASFSKEWVLIKRNAPIYIFKIIQNIIAAIITSTLFLRKQKRYESEDDGATYIGALITSLYFNMVFEYPEMIFTIARLQVFYKHRDLLLCPSWIFTFPNLLLHIPISILESTAWVITTYFLIGFAPEVSRFFKHWLLVILIKQMGAGLFKFLAGVSRTTNASNTIGPLALVIQITLGGFIIPRDIIPKWWIWGYWSSPLSYAFDALAVNEMLSPRWMQKFASNGERLGVAVLDNIGVAPETKWYLIGVAGLVGFIILFNVLYTLTLMYLQPIDKPQAFISKEKALKVEFSGDDQLDGKNTRTKSNSLIDSPSTNPPPNALTGCMPPRKGMILPFTPLTLSFVDINYYVDRPAETEEKGKNGNRHQLLRGVTGTFQPGVLTALMGVSGAGKTTLMDVLAGRKTGGYIEGDINISGYPKTQATFSRISGYCEQNDIHSSQITVQESLMFSVFLRLNEEVSHQEKMNYVNEVMEMVELTDLKDAIVGVPGAHGLSTEQRKRLTIAVELVANPSIIFMDEPTSGLDARAAAIVMRTVKNIVNTGRTIVCTIHQPSIDIFETFDKLLLMKRGGQVIYFGPLGDKSHKLIEYFEEIPGIPKIKEKYNPATWMLEVSSTSTEVQLGLDFADYYRSSDLYEHNRASIVELCKPAPETVDLHFPTRYSQSTYKQFKCCLWKQLLSYWRNPGYNLARFFCTFTTSLFLGSICWRFGKKRENAEDLIMVTGAMVIAVLFVSIANCTAAQPVAAHERTVFYREKAAGLYSALPYAAAQVIVEIPYVLVQSMIFTVMVYSMMSFEMITAKFLWFLFISFFTFLYFTYLGMLSISITPNQEAAAIFATIFYTLFNMFSGFYIPKPKIPGWWIWYYWICPMAWTVQGLIVSQYGDVEDIIKVPGQPDQTIKSYIEDYFGYNTEIMGIVATVLAGFCLFFSLIFAYSIRTLDFQRK